MDAPASTAATFAAALPRPTVFFISDGTGITAETLGQSVLAQFDRLRLRIHRISFVDNPDKALEPQTAYRIMSYGMRKGAFTGRKLTDYIGDAGCDYFNARRIIDALDQAERIQGFAQDLEGALRRSAVNQLLINQ